VLENIIFDDVEKLLLRLGFVNCSPTGRQRVFQHPGSETVIVLPAYEHGEMVRPIHLVGIRKMLVENGLITSAAFDGYMEKVHQ
jgi:predicted RNA binding protein YcfA (HicA-like mRNA interferase family)